MPSRSYKYPKILVSLSGFTIQIQPIRVLQIEDFVKEILNSAQEILNSETESLEHENFDPNNKAHYDWSLEYNPDLIEIKFSPDWSIAKAWDTTYKLREIDKVVYAEPNFALLSPKSVLPTCGTDVNDESSFEVKKEILDNAEWHLEQMQVRDAWNLFKRKGKQPGQGITIAHPDTGYLPHPTLDKKLFSVSTQQDKGQYLEKDKPLVSLDDVLNKYKDSPLPVTFWHGTATASLIVGSEGENAISSSKKRFVTGVAPAAILKPYRLGPNTLDQFEVFSSLIAKAVNDAANKADKENIRVISISFGGYHTLSLRRAIINAQRKGIIVIASAGNNIPFTVWPSTYANVVSVASSNFTRDGIAAHSSIGSRVDVAAPGEHVLAATPEWEDGELMFSVKPRSGTSYATPLVAGIAALWLSYYGWDFLLEKYKKASRIPLVFDKLLRETCTKPNCDWDDDRWGAGIVNAYKLLNAKLPEENDPYIQESLAYREIDHIRLDRGGAKTFIHLFEEVLSDASFLEGISAQILGDIGFCSALNRLTLKLKDSSRSELADKIKFDIAWWAISEIFDKSGKDLRQYLRTFGQEITFHLATDFTLYQRMENLIKKIAGLPTENLDDTLDKIIRDLRDRASEYLKTYLDIYLKSLG